MRVHWIQAVVVGFALLMSGCGPSSKGPEPAKPGTPAFYWAAAEAAYKKGDFGAAVQSLGKVVISDNEYRLRAQVWMMAIDAGMTRGDMEWADVLEAGGKVARARQMDFRKLTTTARTAASQSAMRFADTGHVLQGQLKDEEIPIAFAVPDVNKDKPVELEKLSKGVLPPEAEVEKMHSLMLKRGVLQSVARLGDAGGDVEKAKAALTPGAKLKREEFLMYLAGEYMEMSELYGPKKLDRAGRAKLLLDEGKEALASVPQSAARAKVAKKIDELSKKLPKTAS